MAPRLKQLILEIHHRSLWQVLTIYVGASWFVLEVTDQVIERFLLPEWVYGGAVILLLIGLPIVLATAFVREDVGRTVHPEPAPTSDTGDGAGREAPAPSLSRLKARLFTWPKAILGGVLAFTALGIVSAFIVLRGSARVTEAYGAAGESFGEREWIVVAEFEASEGEEDIALAAREALTIDLSQSRYVNVYGRDKLGPVLRRMELPDTVRLDRRLALEVAERQGLAAVLTGRVNKLGNDYQFIARVIEPGNHRELIGVRTAANAARMIEGVEALSREVRSRLGEESEAIQRSQPLPEVTTTSLEALKLYARAVARLRRNASDEEVLHLVEDAIALDTTFAMAYRLASVASNNLSRFQDSKRYATRAYELRDRLTEVERLHVEAFYHSAVTSDYRQAVEVYERILTRYPDDHRAANNIGVMAYWSGDLEAAYRAYRRGVELNPDLGMGYTNSLATAFSTDRWAAADSLIEQAQQHGFRDIITPYMIGGAFARTEFGRADELCDSLLAAGDDATLAANHRQICGSIDVARGRIDRGVRRLETAARHYMETRQSWYAHQTTGALMVAEQMRGRPAEAEAALNRMLARLPADSLGEQDRVYTRAGLRSFAGLLDRPDLVERIGRAYPVGEDIATWLTDYGEMMGEAAESLAHGRHEAALRALTEGTQGYYDPYFWDALVDLLFGLAYEGVGELDSAVAHLEETVDAGDMANFYELPRRVYLPLALRRLAELEEQRENHEAAVEHYRRFLELWSDADPELAGQVRAAERALARLSGAERI